MIDVDNLSTSSEQSERISQAIERIGSNKPNPVILKIFSSICADLTSVATLNDLLECVRGRARTLKDKAESDASD
jgi:p-aminobenzoyl-glutamate transporter AbgT